MKKWITYEVVSTQIEALGDLKVETKQRIDAAEAEATKAKKRLKNLERYGRLTRAAGALLGATFGVAATVLRIQTSWPGWRIFLYFLAIAMAAGFFGNTVAGIIHLAQKAKKERLEQKLETLKIQEKNLEKKMSDLTEEIGFYEDLESQGVTLLKI